VAIIIIIVKNAQNERPTIPPTGTSGADASLQEWAMFAVISARGEPENGHCVRLQQSTLLASLSLSLSLLGAPRGSLLLQLDH